MRNHRGHEEIAVPAHLHLRSAGSDAPSGIDRRPIVTAGGQAGGLAGRIDAAHLHRHRGNTRQAQHEYHHQCGDRQRRLNGARTGTGR